MRWCLFRHAPTTDNERHVSTGTNPGYVSRNGLPVVWLQGEVLKELPEGRRFSSELNRAYFTGYSAGAIAGYRLPEKRPELNEVHFGHWQGKTVSQAQAQCIAVGLRQYSDMQYFDTRYMLREERQPLVERIGLEPTEEIENRAVRFVHGTIADIAFQDEDAVVYSWGHGSMNAYLIEQAVFLTTGELIKLRSDGGFFGQKATEATVLTFNQSRLAVGPHHFNVDIRDLPQILGNP